MTQHVTPHDLDESGDPDRAERNAELGIRFTLYRDADGRIVAGWQHETPPGSDAWRASRAARSYDVTDAYHELQWSDDTGAAAELRTLTTGFATWLRDPRRLEELPVDEAARAVALAEKLVGFVSSIEAVADRLEGLDG